MVHDGAIYILGGWGMVMLDDVWKSADGVTWTKVRHHQHHHYQKEEDPLQAVVACIITGRERTAAC